MGTRGVLCIADVVIVKFGAAWFTVWLELYVMPIWVVEDEAGKVIVGFGRGCGSDVLEEVYRKTDGCRCDSIGCKGGECKEG